MASKIVLGAAGVLAGVAAALTAITAVTPNWFHATYIDQDCPVGKIGLFSSEWAPASCAGNNTVTGEPRLTGEDRDMDTTEYWPLFPLQYPQGPGNPLAPISQEFVDCETSVDEVFTYVLGVLTDAGLVSVFEAWAGNSLDFTAGEVVLKGTFVGGYKDQLPDTLTDEQKDAMAEAAWVTIYGYVTVCETAGVNDPIACTTVLQNAGALSNLGTAFNTDAPADKEAAIQLCKDDNVDHDNLALCQILIPAGAGMGGLAAVLALAAMAAPPAALAAVVLALGDGAMMLVTLITLKGTPAAAGVGGECTAPDKTCYTQESNALFGLVALILSVLAAVGCLVGYVLAKRESSNALVSL